MRISTRALTLAMTFMALVASPIRAQELDNLRLSESDSSADAFTRDDLAVFPAGIERLFVKFDYTDATRDKMGVELTSPGGSQVYEAAESFTGNGTASFEITGVEMYRRLSEDLVAYAQATESIAKELEKSSVGFRGHLSSIEGNAASMRNSAGIIDSWDLPAGPSADLVDLQEAIETIQDNAQKARDLGEDDDAGRKAVAQAIAADADLAASAAESLESYGLDVDDLPIPPTDADLGTAYTVQVQQQGSPSMSMEFWVTDESLPEPTATEPPPPTRSAADQPTANLSGSTPRATRASTEEAVSASERLDTASNPTAAARATAIRQQLATEAAVELESGVSSDPASVDQAADAASAESAAGEETDSTAADAPDALPTWTPVPGSEGAGGPDPDESTEPGGSGPNLAILGLGILALAAIALWLRRRV